MTNALPTNYLETSSLIVGIILGAFYGFGGWSNVPSQVAFQNSPRVRDFRWVVGAGFASFLTDFKIFDPNLAYSKPRLFSFYLFGFAIIVLAIIGIFSLVIYFKHRNLAKSMQGSSMVFNPVQDFLVYGYNYYQKNLQAVLKCYGESRLELFQKKLLPEYARHIAIGITDIALGHAVSNDNAKREFTRQVLKSMCAIVIAHHPDGQSNGLMVNANYMQAIRKSTVPPDFLSRLRFHFGDVDRYPHFLALKDYAFDTDGKESFILPVEAEEAGGKSLPGAPEAFLRNRTVVVDNTSQIKYSPDLDAKVAANSKKYFEKKSKKFKSFASLVIAGEGGNPVGIVNIESNHESIFGRTEDDKTQVSDLLYPFCSMLALVVK